MISMYKISTYRDLKGSLVMLLTRDKKASLVSLVLEDLLVMTD